MKNTNQFDYKYFILVTDFEGSDDSVLIHATRIRANNVMAVLDRKGKKYGECYEIPEKDIQFYLYEPMYCDAKTEDNILTQ